MIDLTNIKVTVEKRNPRHSEVMKVVFPIVFYINHQKLKSVSLQKRDETLFSMSWITFCVRFAKLASSVFL